MSVGSGKRRKNCILLRRYTYSAAASSVADGMRGLPPLFFVDGGPGVRVFLLLFFESCCFVFRRAIFAAMRLEWRVEVAIFASSKRVTEADDDRIHVLFCYLPFQVDNIRSLQSDVALEGINHWVMVEAKDEVTDIAASWLHA